ncbi:MAG: retropepsin-like domain-containing protein [Planctomycetaceae bacterium]|nr:retropepsin-like domain-containing protein [Planctomycetaceae bacterium]
MRSLSIRKTAMGLTYAEITLVNVIDLELARRGTIKESEVRKVPIRALVDSGALTLVINEATRKKLGMEPSSQKIVRTADGGMHFVPVIKGVNVQFLDRDTTCDAWVTANGPDCLLGAIPIEGLDVVIDLNKQELIPNPENPDGPVYIMY